MPAIGFFWLRKKRGKNPRFVEARAETGGKYETFRNHRRNRSCRRTACRTGDRLEGIYDEDRYADDQRFRPFLGKLGESKGFVANYLWSCGDTSIATLKPARTIDDFKGRKIRVLATPLERAVMDKMGATGVPMPDTEVLPAMQRKVIDGVRSGIIVMYPSKFWTVAKYITLTGMGQIACGLFLSKAWLKTLPADLHKMVFEAGDGVTPHAGKWGDELTKKAEENWVRDAEVIRLSDADQKELRKRVRPFADDILCNDPATKDMYALLKKAVAATKR